MSISIKEVYEWHMENARECIGRSDLKEQAEAAAKAAAAKAALLEKLGITEDEAKREHFVSLQAFNSE